MHEKEKVRLRDLASKYTEYARGTPMDERREKWRLHNGLKEKTYPFHIEDNGSYLKDQMPPLECEDDECRALEGRLLRAITAYETIDDDRIIPDRFVVDWHTPMTALCDEMTVRHADDGRGGSLGYETNKPIRDIDADFGKLKKREITLDRETTERRAQLARDAFAGLLPVEVGRPGSMYSSGLTNKAVHLMGMQEMYLQMALNPDAVARLFAFLSEETLRLGAWEEEQKLLTLNHDGNQGYCSGSSQYSDETTVTSGDRVRTTDRYGYMESQESAGISAEMFDHFVMPHLSQIAPKFKMFKFGCCEPVHDFMPVLERLPGLRKVSVTPWCDIKRLTQTCRQDVIWSRKPVPLKLCGETFSLDELRAHLKETLDVGQDYFIEFIYRDTTSLTGEMVDRVTRACEMIRELTGHREGSRG